MLNVDTGADVVKEMERNMRISEDVLRYQTVRVEKFEEGPSAVLRNRSSRDDDRRRDRYDDDRGERYEEPRAAVSEEPAGGAA
jgi:small subunit ribosomal protein S6